MPIRAAASLETLVAGYVEELRLRRAAPATLERARVELARLLQHLREAGVRDVRAVDEAQLAAYARRLERWPARYGGRLSLATRASALSVVRCFFASLARRGRLLRDPAAGIPLPHAARLPQGVLSQSQARRLVAEPFPGTALGLRDRALLELLYGAGLRAGEVRRAGLNDYDPQRRVLLVRDGKGRKDRLVPVPGRAAAALERYLADARAALVKRGDGSLFVSRHGGRLSVSALQLLVRRHGKAIGVALHPHTLRHTCATHLLQGGASIRHVQQLLGHRRLTTTALYTRVAIRDLRAVLARTHPRM